MVKEKALFLDRDGVINIERDGYSWRCEELQLVPGLADALKPFVNKGFRIIVITNQSGIAKGLYTRYDTERFNNLIIKKLAGEGVKIDEIYYCPHHPSEGRCFCRKPGDLLFRKALARFGIDAASSFMLGDSKRDVDAAEKTGIKGILVEKNKPVSGYLKKLI